MPKFRNQPYIPDYDMAVEYDGSGRQLYIGYASPGAKTSDASWMIYKHEFDSNGRITKRRFANGNATLNKIWDNRATAYDYLDI